MRGLRGLLRAVGGGQVDGVGLGHGMRSVEEGKDGIGGKAYPSLHFFQGSPGFGEGDTRFEMFGGVRHCV